MYASLTDRTAWTAVATIARPQRLGVLWRCGPVCVRAACSADSAKCFGAPGARLGRIDGSCGRAWSRACVGPAGSSTETRLGLACARLRCCACVSQPWLEPARLTAYASAVLLASQGYEAMTCVCVAVGTTLCCHYASRDEVRHVASCSAVRMRHDSH